MRYEVGIFEKGVDEVCAVGELVHVFVDSDTGRPSKNSVDTWVKEALIRCLRVPSKL